MRGLTENPKDQENQRSEALKLIEELELTPTSGDKARPSICIIEDDGVTVQLMKAILASEKYPVLSFEDPLVALAQIKEYNITLLFLDIKLPGMNGLELLAKLRVEDAIPACKVIVSTGYAKREIIMQILQAPIDGIVFKPFRKEIVLRYASRFGKK